MNVVVVPGCTDENTLEGKNGPIFLPKALFSAEEFRAQGLQHPMGLLYTLRNSPGL